MAKIIVFNLITVDGYFCGPKGEIDWHRVDAEFSQFAAEQLAEVGTLIFGRVTYDVMYPYWPNAAKEAATSKPDPIANAMNGTPKIVFSRTMEKAEWENTKLMKEINPEEIKRLKQESEKGVYIFGSGQIVRAFANLGLIDEYRLLVNPIILGSGKPLFKDVKKQNLKLLNSREFKNGNVLLRYQTINN
jgi:dihydrofolate reductase